MKQDGILPYRIRKGIRQWLQVLPFIGAGLVLMCLFVLYPLLRNILVSVSEYNLMTNTVGSFSGFANYIEMFRDPDYILALRNTALYTLITVPGQLACGLILAYLLNSVRRGQTLFKVITYLPVITSWVIVSLLFKFIFSSGKGGLINYALMGLSLTDHPVAWLQNEWTANVVLWLFGIWKGTGWTMLIYLAALQGIPKHIYEAAEVDGASGIRKFLKITVPLVKNTTLYLTTVLTIGAFGAYIHVMLITDGGPLGRTEELMNYMYNTAFGSWDFSYSAAQAVVMGVMIFTLSFVQRRITKEMVN